MPLPASLKCIDVQKNRLRSSTSATTATIWRTASNLPKKGLASLGCLLRQPNETSAVIVLVGDKDAKASFVFVGEFNVHHREWLNSISPTDGHGLRALDFSSESGCELIIHKPTHRSGNCLDLFFADSPGVVVALSYHRSNKAQRFPLG